MSDSAGEASMFVSFSKAKSHPHVAAQAALSGTKHYHARLRITSIIGSS
jgi:hypothetical protein